MNYTSNAGLWDDNQYAQCSDCDTLIVFPANIDDESCRLLCACKGFVYYTVFWEEDNTQVLSPPAGAKYFCGRVDQNGNYICEQARSKLAGANGDEWWGICQGCKKAGPIIQVEGS